MFKRWAPTFNATLVFFLLQAFAASLVFAASPKFDNITVSDLQLIAKDFASVFAHTSVSPASSLGELWGFELGGIMGAAQVPGVQELVEKADPNADKVSYVPHLAFFGAITVPGALTIEVSILPALIFGDLELAYQTLAIKWTFTDRAMPMPFDMALKAHYSTSSLFYNQDINAVDTEVEINDQVMGVTLITSQKLLILEPYFGLGYINAKGSATLSGQEEFFAFTDSQSASADVSGLQAYIGLNINLAIFRAGLEAGRLFDANKVSLKVSAHF